jgi:2'-5' RNA ligase
MPHQKIFFDPDSVSSDDQSVAKSEKHADPNQVYNVFFGLVPDRENALSIARQAAEWNRQFGMSGKLLAPEQLHVSLHPVGTYIGEVPAEQIQFAKRIGEALSAQVFDIVFDRAMSFKGRKSPYVLRVREGLENIKGFWRELGINIANAGGNSKEVTFTPHMTLSYHGRMVTEHHIAPIAMQVRDFVLINSHYGKSRYDVLARWQLSA